MCCCCSLKTRGTIIGVIHIILGAVLIYATVILGTEGALPPAEENPEDDLSLILYKRFLPEHANSDVNAESMKIKVSLILLSAGVLTIIQSILLLCGIYKKSPYLLKIWIFTQILILSLAILRILQLLAMHHIYPPTFTFVCVFELCFIPVVIYLRREFLEEKPNIMPTVV